MRIKICRKEAKESILWLKLLDTNEDAKIEELQSKLIDEGIELMKLFNAIVTKSQNTGFEINN
jgi:hypothetical protein